jgi:hypothetical protein
MGRSVSYHSDRQALIYIAYGSATNDDGDYIDDYEIQSDTWENFMEYVTEVIQEVCPSMAPSESEWQGNEVRKFLENGLASVWVSEYSGLVSLSFVPASGDYVDQGRTNLGAHWIDQVVPKIEARLKQHKTKVLNKVGSFSNGEGVYELQ